MINKCGLLNNLNSHIFITKRYRWTTTNIQLFASLFDVPVGDFQKHKYKYDLTPVTEQQLRSSAAAREKMGISKKEWVQHPALLTTMESTLMHRYLHLKEGGFRNIDANVIAKFSKLVHKRIDFLKAHNFIPTDTNVAESFISHLNPKAESLMNKGFSDDSTFEDLYHIILIRYLMWKFNATEEETKKFCRVYSLSKVKSFKILCENFVIAEELGFPPKAVWNNGYLLLIYPDHFKSLLAEIPFAASAGLCKTMRRYPKLAVLPLEHYKKIYKYLKEEKISDEAIRQGLDIFLLSLETIKLRFKEIKSVPELRILLNNQNILKLIVQHNEVRSRLSFLKQMQMRCTPTNILNINLNRFNHYISSGKDENSANEVLTFVNGLLKGTLENTKTNLQKHRYYKHVPLVEIKRSYELLQSLRFPDASLQEVVQVLLYPSHKIVEAHSRTKEFLKSKKQKGTPTQKLNLMLYFLEQEHHFTGNGIWNNWNNTTDT